MQPDPLYHRQRLDHQLPLCADDQDRHHLAPQVVGVGQHQPIAHDEARSATAPPDAHDRTASSLGGAPRCRPDLLDAAHFRPSSLRPPGRRSQWWCTCNLQVTTGGRGPPIRARNMRSMPTPPADVVSPLGSALERVGDRWSFLVVAALLEGPLRFNALQERLGQIAPNILSQRLRRLEQQRVLRSVPYSDRPPRLEYALTADGIELAGVLRLLAGWGAAGDAGAAGGEAEPLRHVACGTALEVAWYCPTCVTAVDEPDPAALRHL